VGSIGSIATQADLTAKVMVNTAMAGAAGGCTAIALKVLSRRRRDLGTVLNGAQGQGQGLVRRAPARRCAALQRAGLVRRAPARRCAALQRAVLRRSPRCAPPSLKLAAAARRSRPQQTVAPAPTLTA